MMHLNRVSKRQNPPNSGHQNILKAGDKFFVRIGSIDYPTRYTKDELPNAVVFRDRVREQLGLPKAEF